MHETPEEYTRRILGYLQGKDPLKVLASSPIELAKLLRGVRKQLLMKRPEPDRWSVAEILAHLADGELVFGFRVRLILGAPGTPVQAFDQDAWAAYSQYGTHDPQISLEAFRILRDRNIRLLKSLPEQMWGHYGIHTERGKETVTRVVEMTAGHDINHLEQVRRLVRKKSRAA